MSSKGFASTTDLAEKKITFSEIGTDLYAFTAEGDPNTQATPAMAKSVIERVRTVTDKPIKYVVLSHYHAVRVLGASAYRAQGVVGFARNLPADRGAGAARTGIPSTVVSRVCFRTPKAFRG